MIAIMYLKNKIKVFSYNKSSHKFFNYKLICKLVT